MIYVIKKMNKVILLRSLDHLKNGIVEKSHDWLKKKSFH
jgi:hypothetical protein